MTKVKIPGACSCATTSSSGGVAVSGLTATRIPFATSATALSDDAALVWDNTAKAVTIGTWLTIGVKGLGSGSTHPNYFFGAAAGKNPGGNSVGDNIGIGTYSLAALTNAGNSYDASNNIGIGYQAMVQTTSGADNIAIGTATLYSSLVSVQNIAIGTQALQYYTGVGQTTAVGHQALQLLTTGTENSAFGAGALGGCTTGQRNTAIGWTSGHKITTGNYNTLVGTETMELLTTGSSNTAVGWGAGIAVDGSGNTFIGDETFGYEDPPTYTHWAMSGNVGVGYKAGWSEVFANYCTTAQNCTFVGTESGLGSTTQVNNSAGFGFRAHVYSNNSMAFGSDLDAYRCNYGFGGESYGGGLGVAYFRKAITNPTSAPTNGFLIWADATTGEGYFRNPGGSATAFSAGGGGGVTMPLTSSQLQINNPAATFKYTFTAAAIAADRTITLPLLTGADVMVTADFAQTLTNKTLGTGTIGTTQSALTNNTTLATTAYVDRATGKLDKIIVANRQTASYTLVLADGTDSKLVEMNVGSANNLTVPPNSSVAFPTGTQILIAQYGAGQTTVLAGSGVTLRSDGAKLKINAQYGTAGIVKIAGDEWYVFGDLAA